MAKQLYRSKTNKMLTGVCGGLSDYLNIDASIIRLIFVLVTIFLDGTGLVIYLILALIIPSPDRDAEIIIEEVFSTGKDKMKENQKGVTFLVGAILVVVGAYFLADIFFAWLDFNVVISAILILLGFYIIMRGRGVSKNE